MIGQANDDMCGLLSIYIPSVSTHPSDHPSRARAASQPPMAEDSSSDHVL